jgi:uncharacterized membrane protein
MRIAFKEKPYDLLAVIVLGSVLVVLAGLAQSGPLRVAFGLLFILFLPGYALIAALFPKDGDLDWIERIALSFGLSIAVVPLIGLLLNYTPWGIRLEPIIASLMLFTVSMCLVAYYRRRILDVEDRLSFSVDVTAPNWKEYGMLDKVLTIGLVVSVIIAVGTLVYVLTVPRVGERFTEFYILDEGGMAEDYPSKLNVSENATVLIGVTNREFETVNYTVDVRLVTVEFVYNETSGRNDTVELGSAALESFSVVLENKQTWEEPFTFNVTQPGDYKLYFLLYEGPVDGEPYRSLHLWITVI